MTKGLSGYGVKAEAWWEKANLFFKLFKLQLKQHVHIVIVISVLRSILIYRPTGIEIGHYDSKSNMVKFQYAVQANVISRHQMVELSGKITN